jgi:hypothetical protein
MRHHPGTIGVISRVVLIVIMASVMLLSSSDAKTVTYHDVNDLGNGWRLVASDGEDYEDFTPGTNSIKILTDKVLIQINDTGYCGLVASTMEKITTTGWTLHIKSSDNTCYNHYGVRRFTLERSNGVHDNYRILVNIDDKNVPVSIITGAQRLTT